MVKLVNALEFKPGPHPCNQIDERIFRFVYKTLFRGAPALYDKKLSTKQQYLRCIDILGAISTSLFHSHIINTFVDDMDVFQRKQSMPMRQVFSLLKIYQRQTKYIDNVFFEIC